MDKKEYKKYRKLKKFHRKYGVKKGSLLLNARRMEGAPTPYEQAFGKFLKGHRKKYGYYKRQYPLYTKKPEWRGYIYDFFIREPKVLVEIDGGHHSPEYDKDKNELAIRKGYSVLHIPNKVAVASHERLEFEVDDFIASGEKLRYVAAGGSV